MCLQEIAAQGMYDTMPQTMHGKSGALQSLYSEHETPAQLDSDCCLMTRQPPWLPGWDHDSGMAESAPN